MVLDEEEESDHKHSDESSSDEYESIAEKDPASGKLKKIRRRKSLSGLDGNEKEDELAQNEKELKSLLQNKFPAWDLEAVKFEAMFEVAEVSSADEADIGGAGQTGTQVRLAAEKKRRAGESKDGKGQYVYDAVGRRFRRGGSRVINERNSPYESVVNQDISNYVIVQANTAVAAMSLWLNNIRKHGLLGAAKSMQKSSNQVRRDVGERFLRKLPTPALECTFLLPKQNIELSEDEEEEMKKLGQKAATEYRLAVMSLGMIQTFTQIIQIDIEWPPIFVDISFYLSFFSFSFDFFHPECSARLAYWKLWLGFTLMPYGLVMPLYVAWVICRIFLFEEMGSGMKKALLFNGFVRSVCVIMLLFLPMHFKQVLMPFDCVMPTSGKGIPSLRKAPEVLCDPDDVSFIIMLNLARYGLFTIFLLFTWMCTNVYRSFFWQYGNQVRDVMPVYVAIVEMASLDMKGYNWDVRRHLWNDQMVLQAYHLQPYLICKTG